MQYITNLRRQCKSVPPNPQSQNLVMLIYVNHQGAKNSDTCKTRNAIPKMWTKNAKNLHRYLKAAENKVCNLPKIGQTSHKLTAHSIMHFCTLCKVKVKLSRWFMSRFFAIWHNRFRTDLQYSPCSLDPMPLPQYGALAWRPSQGTKLYCLVNRGTLGVNNLPRVVARIMPQPESNARPLDHKSDAPYHYTTETPLDNRHLSK